MFVTRYFVEMLFLSPDGQVEIDGKYAGGHIRPENKAEDRIDRRLKKYQNMKRLCALAIRQRGLGSQTFTRIIRDEDSNAAWAAVRDHVAREATVFADEHGSYNDLAGLNELRRVNHSKAYQTDDGTNTKARMRKDALDNLGFEEMRINDRDGYIAEIEERYVADALNSLSIEGYEVSEELIERVRDGQWKPGEHAQNFETKNALAAKGYRLAFEEVREDIRKILDGAATGDLLEERHQDWFRAMLSPSVTAGIIKAHQLAGYRSYNVYLRGSSHVPLPPHAIPDAMDALFKCISQEPDARVKAVLAPFLFAYIHPFPDGNGRTARFIMNALLADSGVSWIVIPVARRDEYMNALEEASQHENIVPLTTFVSELVKTPPPARDAQTAWKAK